MANKLMDFFLGEIVYYKRVAKKITKGNSFLADELMQELALAIMAHKGETQNPRSFLNMCMSNEYRQYIAVSRNKTFQNSEQFETKHEEITNTTAFDTLSRKQFIKQVKQVINKNSQFKAFKIIELRIMEDKSNEEIGKELGLTAEQVRSNIKVNKFNGNYNELKDLL